MPTLNESPVERSDCHCHTTFSDGSLSVAALLALAHERALHGLSITDHDTLAAYETARPLAKTLGVDLISGIEISTEFRRKSIHVLGYAFDLQHPDLQQFCVKLQAERTQRNHKILERLAAIKMPITMVELATDFPDRTIGRPHMAALMVKKGYAKSLKEAFDRYLGDKGRCYVAGVNVEIPEAIELIQRAKGFAVLAHPQFIAPKRLLTEIINFPFDGIEAYYAQNTLPQAAPWVKIAVQKGWFTTGGSDFHAPKNNYYSLGSSWTPIETFKVFSQRFAQNNS